MAKKHSSTTAATDLSNDRQYFVVTPHLVWALCEDPYEFTLWSTIKMITREGETCRLTTPDLAELSMMSLDKVHNCRKRLLDVGLLIGEIKKKDLHNPQPIWHLTIPDIWEPNIAWNKENNSIEKKLSYKRLQRQKFKENRKSLRTLKDLQKSQNDTPHDALPKDEALLSGKQNTPLQVVEAFRQAKMVTASFSSGENGSQPHENGSLLYGNGSRPHENSLYIEKPDQKPIKNAGQKPTTTILPIARATRSLHGGGGSLPTDQIERGQDHSLEPPKPICNHMLSARAKLQAMRMLASQIIDAIPTRWWGKEEYINSLDAQKLYQLCAWLWIWQLVHQEIRRGGLWDEETFQLLQRKRDAELIYGPLWVNVHNEPAVIKTRMSEIEAPLDDQDRELLNQRLLEIAKELQEETNGPTS
jgi:hypothetical protein